MPAASIVFFKDDRGRLPAYEWLQMLGNQDSRAHAVCINRLRILGELGIAIRRPYLDFLRGGIHELRMRHCRRQLRILYFFHGRALVVLTQGVEKEGRVPDAEIERAIQRRQLYLEQPQTRGEEARIFHD